MDSLFPFVLLSLFFLCQAVDGAMALHIPLTRASLSRLEAPPVVTLELGFYSIFITGKSPRTSTYPPRIPNSTFGLGSSPVLHLRSLHGGGNGCGEDISFFEEATSYVQTTGPHSLSDHDLQAVLHFTRPSTGSLRCCWL